MAEGGGTKKTSVTQLVHSTIGLGLLKATDAGFGACETAARPQLELAKTLLSPDQENMAGRLQFYSKTSAGSMSSAVDSEWGLSSLDSGARPARGRLPHQPSQDG
jgi:hypothetical protein